MQENKTKFKRNIIFIKRGMQLKFIALALLLALFCVLVCVYEFVSLTQVFFAEHPVLLHELISKGQQAIPLSLVKIGLFFAVIAIFAAVLSNKFAGPVYRFETVCKEVAKGNYKVRVKLRDGDALRGLEKEFNTMLEALDAKHQGQGNTDNEK